LMLQEFFLPPTGQIPAYEWNFRVENHCACACACAWLG
jgi:hypothetical protein